jgi:hypothetical protein
MLGSLALLIVAKVRERGWVGAVELQERHHFAPHLTTYSLATCHPLSVLANAMTALLGASW